MEIFRATLAVLTILFAAAIFMTGCGSSANVIQASDDTANISSENIDQRARVDLQGLPLPNPFSKTPIVPAQVVDVIDGSTIEVVSEGEQYIVSYVGINTPRYNDIVLGTEPLGEESAQRNRNIVEGRTVYLEKDSVEMDRDGRRLRYVYVDDILVSAVLVSEGLARLGSYSFGLKHYNLMHKLQLEAALERKGGWRDAWRNTIPKK